MKRNKFSGTKKEDIKFAACIGLTSVPKIHSFSKTVQNRQVLEEKKPTFTENNTLETKIRKKEDYDNITCRTSIFSLPSLIRIRATDKEGNTIEVTY